MKDSNGIIGFASKVHIPPPILLMSLSELGVSFSKYRRKRKDASGCAAMKAIGSFLSLTGFTVSATAAVYMIKEGQSPNPKNQKSKVVTSGPFVASRNPIYLGSLLAALGRSFANRSIAGMVATAAGWIYVDRVIVPGEERYLTEQFVNSYIEYRDKTARWIGSPISSKV
ncbi:Protein-S-isoprenylcysteine O-methyltransferase Ste14 [Ferrithrix thermotolerans DSM 19514]|uniref:Protein-S-isoprenylcysteine O-methyltransferase Ste14 n=1 Tax=Ferrithrix thermotolerans DSM 19514 TaxID=1121881 RepID=A0A1M4ULE3_9ACTN|nr:isoprenylcysteine carboxylmethyltransferase family protein [Ferrithrix thermotolerans]SHE57393.1 Protein-S-isoprenylcysteine O-methyltransferase Ste14 [Ferrithrix thermotolerans DSM 19514]